jgi:hypothetical protein
VPFLLFRTMPALEEITYEAGRAALADQESLVSGIRQRTGTLLAAHALVASFSARPRSVPKDSTRSGGSRWRLWFWGWWRLRLCSRRGV